MGTFLYNYSIRPEEHTIAEALKGAGYATGMFGKWHLGPVKAGSPTNPGAKGFDHWIAHDNFFENDPSFCVDGSAPKQFKGESSAVTVEIALKFIEKQCAAEKPFFAYICFGSPHTPHKAADEFKKLYPNSSAAAQNYMGEVSGIDAAMGTLRESLKRLNIADDTLLWFASDNGASKGGSTGGLRGKKGSVWEGGVRVPAILEWPARIKTPFTTTVTSSTCDMYPTILDLLDIERPDDRPLDGISLVPLMDGTMKTRPSPLAFWVFDRKGGKDPWIDPGKQKGNWRTFKNWKYPNPRTSEFGGGAAIIDGRYKYHSGGTLYDLQADPKESKDLAGQQADVARRMKRRLEEWQTSVERSLSGADYQ
jgi:arylsulfatase A-like enzyme